MHVSDKPASSARLLLVVSLFVYTVTCHRNWPLTHHITVISCDHRQTPSVKIPAYLNWWCLLVITWSCIYNMSQKVAPPLKHFAIFSFMVNLCDWKLPWLLPKHNSYVYTNFGPFIWILVWIVSLLLVGPLQLNNSVDFITKLMNLLLTITQQVTSNDI